MFRHGNDISKEGDSIILWEGHGNVNVLKLKVGEKYNCKRGHYDHNDMIGKPWGTKIYSEYYRVKKKNKRKKQISHIIMLKPTPELWTQAVPHRTQILYQADISLIVFRLLCKPGDTVIESGTGSGSLSVHFARAIQPTGHLYTFEFNENRVNAAKLEFNELEIHNIITVTHRDICGTGFPTERSFYEKGIEKGVNAIFLDLPNPVSPLTTCFEILNENCYLCSFSPCIEQVQRTANRLRELGFVNIEVVEVLQRHYFSKEYDNLESPFEGENKIKKRIGIRPYNEMFGHTGYLTFALKPVSFTPPTEAEN